MQINFRHAWIDDTVNGEFKKLGKQDQEHIAYIRFTTFCI